MNIERLQKVSDYLRTIPEHKFDLDSFLCAIERTNAEEELKDHNCGTTGCAVGYFPLIFPDDWEYSKDYELGIGQKGFYNKSLTIQSIEYLEIDVDTWYFLFSSNAYNFDERKPISVANRIDTVIHYNLINSASS